MGGAVGIMGVCENTRGDAEFACQFSLPKLKKIPAKHTKSTHNLVA